jgi:N-acetylglucosamine kinase-like BadF-type ATPase
MPERDTEAAMKAVEDAIEQVVKDGGVVHEDSLFDATEMALVGASKESMVERIKMARAEPYVANTRWRTRT